MKEVLETLRMPIDVAAHPPPMVFIRAQTSAERTLLINYCMSSFAVQLRKELMQRLTPPNPTQFQSQRAQALRSQPLRNGLLLPVVLSVERLFEVAPELRTPASTSKDVVAMAVAKAVVSSSHANILSSDLVRQAMQMRALVIFLTADMKQNENEHFADLARKPIKNAERALVEKWKSNPGFISTGEAADLLRNVETAYQAAYDTQRASVQESSRMSTAGSSVNKVLESLNATVLQALQAMGRLVIVSSGIDAHGELLLPPVPIIDAYRPCRARTRLP